MSDPSTPPEKTVDAEPRRLSVTKKIVYAACTVLCFLVAIEGGTRLLVMADVLDAPQRSDLREKWRAEGWDVDPVLGWQLRPESTSMRGPARCVTNSFGIRDHELPLRKPSGEYRMLSIGDSTALGFGVGERAAYAGALEELLRAETRRPVEVINAGVPGYTSAQALLYLEHRGLLFEPDAVIVQTNFNDRRAIPPGDVPDSPDRFESIASTLRLREALDYSMLVRVLRGTPDPKTDREHWFQSTGDDYDEIDLDRPPRVSLTQYEANMREIIRLSREHGADVYLVGLPDYPDLVKNVRRAAEAVAAKDFERATTELADEEWFAGSEVYRMIRQKLQNAIHTHEGRAADVETSVPVNLNWTAADGYLPTALSAPYLDVLTRLGEEFDIPVIVPTPGGEEINLDYIHLNAAGHAQVARRLAAAVVASDSMK